MTTTTVPATAAKDAFLRFAMRLDAVLTGLAGIVGLAIAPRLAELSGTSTATEYAMGVFFVAYTLVMADLQYLGLRRMRS